MTAEELNALHLRERDLWAAYTDAKLDEAMAVRAAEKAGEDATPEIDAARNQTQQAVKDWSECYNQAKAFTADFLKQLGLDPQRVRAML